MIDLHHHCLPGVDDGPRTLEQSIEQCRLAFDEGIETVVATPHVLRGHWENASKEVLRGLVSELDAALGGSPRILEGSEYWFAHDMVELLEHDRAILPLAGSRYILLEFAAHAIPPLVDSVLYRLRVGGWVPVIAHPERNLVFRSKPELLRSLIRQGARTQVTAMSLTGEFGAAARKAAVEWIDAGMVHFVATDAHDAVKRPPSFTAAYSRVRSRFGEEMAECLFRRNPQAVLENRALPFDPDPEERPRGGLMSSIRRFFER